MRVPSLACTEINFGFSLINILEFHGEKSLSGVILHFEEFGESKVIASEEVKHIAIIGAGKVSADMVDKALRSEETVTWIIGKMGGYWCWIFCSYKPEES